MFQENFVKINDYEQVITKKYNYITIKVTNVVLKTSVEIQVMFYDSNKVMGDMKMLTLTGSDYTNWGNDDSYIVNMICQKFGLTLSDTTTSSVITPSLSDTTTSSVRIPILADTTSSVRIPILADMRPLS